MNDRARAAGVAGIVESVVLIGRSLAAARRVPFADVSLTATQLDALFLLAHAATPMTPGGLATRLGVTRGAVTQLVEGLRGQGLVTQITRPDDARSRLIVLTEHAAATVRDFEQEMVESIAPAFARLSDAEIAQVHSLLGKVDVAR